MAASLSSEKKCSRCKEVKSLSDFARNKAQRLGRSNYCLTCSKAYSKEWTTPEKLAKKYEARRTPEKMASHKNYWLSRKYGITLDQFNQKWADQGSCCHICKTTENSKGKSFAVDHCHKTGKVRGILCDNCNHILGKANDDQHILLRAAEYLKSQV